MNTSLFHVYTRDYDAHDDDDDVESEREHYVFVRLIFGFLHMNEIEEKKMNDIHLTRL